MTDKWQQRWREANAAIVRAHMQRAQFLSRLRRFGLTEEQFKAMLKRQKGRCAICQEALTPPCIDHDHKTGIVRKLLCRTCNAGLGMFKDDTRLLAGAIVYLQEHEAI